MEGGPAAPALVDPGVAAVEGREPGDQGQADADAPVVGQGRGRPGPAGPPEGLEDGAGQLGRHARPGVLDDQLQVGPPGQRLDPHPGPRGRVPGRVEQEVLHDPLDLGAVDERLDGLGLDVDRPAGELVDLGDHPVDELADVGQRPVGLEHPLLEPVQVEQVLEQPLQLPGLLDQHPDQVKGLLAGQVEPGPLQGDGHPEHGRERGAQVVGDGPQEGVLHVVKGPQLVGGGQLAAQAVLELLLALGQLHHGGPEAGVELAVLDQGDDLAGDDEQPDHGAGEDQERLELAGGDLDAHPGDGGHDQGRVGEGEPGDRRLLLVVAAAQLGHGRLEGGGRQQQPADHPAGVDHGPGAVAAGRVLVGEAEVGDQQREHGGGDHRQVDNTPAAGAGEQHQHDGPGHDVAERVGQAEGPLEGSRSRRRCGRPRRARWPSRGTAARRRSAARPAGSGAAPWPAWAPSGRPAPRRSAAAPRPGSRRRPASARPGSRRGAR